MKFEEGRIIKENPLRILGVFSNTSKKDIVANLGKLRAFAKTGKTLSFVSDFTSLLGPVNRTSDTIEKANNDISLPKDKLQAGMFWFMQHTDNDKAALDCLKSGDVNGAMAIIQKKGNYSGVVNMAVLALILKRWDIALYSYAYLLESATRRGALVKAFTDTEDYFSEDDLADYISFKLIHDFPSAHWIEQLQHENVELGEKSYPFKSRFENSLLLTKIASECTITIKKVIDDELDKAALVSRDDAKANLSMAAAVEEKCKPLLKELRFALGKANNTYIEYADQIANQIIDNCINYYTHDADNLKRAQNVIKYIRFAYRTAESKTTKERAKKNLVILNETLENLIPEFIEGEYNAIDKLVKRYHEENSIGDCSYLLGTTVDNAYKQILSIRNKVGKENKHYLSISSNFVAFAIQEVIKEVNKFSKYRTESERSAYIASLEWGRQIFDSLVKFDKNIECNARFDKNLSVLMSLVRKNAQKRVFPNIRVKQTLINNTSETTQSNRSKSYSHNYSRESKLYVRSNNHIKASIIFVICFAVFMIVMFFLYTKNVITKQPIAIIETKEVTTDSILVEDSADESLAENTYSANNTSSSGYENNSGYTENKNLSNNNFELNDIRSDLSYSTIQYKTGDRPYKSRYGKGNYDYDTENSLLIKNGSSTDAVVFLERINGNKVRHVFIKRGENFKMTNIPGGNYLIKIMQGVDWNPEKDNGSGNPKGGFMKSISLTKSESYDPFVFPYPSSGEYVGYEVTLYKVQNGNMQTQIINENQLF